MNYRIRYVVIAMLFFCGKAEIALPQNLVPNWSFEEFNDSCTNQIDPGFFENVKGWFPKRYLQGTINSVSTYSTRLLFKL